MEDKLPFEEQRSGEALKSKKLADDITLGVGILLVMLIIIAIVVFGIDWYSGEDKVKDNAESQIKLSISNEDVTSKEINIDNVESIKFKSREEDPVGFFEYIEKDSKITSSGVSYNSYLEYYRATNDKNYDPEQGTKTAYIITGTYTATHVDDIDIDGEFRIVYVSMENQLCMVEQSYWGSDDMLKKTVINRATAELLATYDIQPNPDIEITYIDKEKNQYNDFYTDCVVYGKANIKNKFGEKFTVKFTAEYQYNDHDQYFEEQSFDIK